MKAPAEQTVNGRLDHDLAAITSGHSAVGLAVGATSRAGAATRRLRRLCTTGTEMASNAAPYGLATQSGQG